METIDFSSFDDDGFVLHFGGRTGEIDAFTFGNALVSISETIRSINQTVNPGYSLEISIEAVGEGSFRARLKTGKKSLRNLFSVEIAKDILISLLCAFLWEKVISPEEPPTIIVNDESVIIQHGSDRIIVPREAYEQKSRVEQDPAVNRHIARTMEILENDPSVESFGIARDLRGPRPVIDIPRSAFPIIRQNALPPAEEGSRYQDHSAVLSVHKAVFERSSRKWEFIWNGFKISASINDPAFFDRLEARQVSLHHGDAFEAILRVHQTFDLMSGNWINSRYEVIFVGDVVARKPEQFSSGI